MNAPDNLKYSNDHEWMLIEGNTVTIGITDYAQSKMGDIVYVELPAQGENLTAGQAFGVIESVKSVSDCNAPVGGKVKEINTLLNDSPQTVNEDCYGEGWMVKVEIDDKARTEIEKLMDHKAYEKFVAEES